MSGLSLHTPNYGVILDRQWYYSHLISQAVVNIGGDDGEGW